MWLYKASNNIQNPMAKNHKGTRPQADRIPESALTLLQQILKELRSFLTAFSNEAARGRFSRGESSADERSVQLATHPKWVQMLAAAGTVLVEYLERALHARSELMKSAKEAPARGPVPPPRSDRSGSAGAKPQRTKTLGPREG